MCLGIVADDAALRPLLDLELTPPASSWTPLDVADGSCVVLKEEEGKGCWDVGLASAMTECNLVRHLS